MKVFETSGVPTEESALNEMVREQALSRRRFLEMVGLAGGGVAATSLFVACGGSSKSTTISNSTASTGTTTSAATIASGSPASVGSGSPAASTTSASSATTVSGPAPKSGGHLTVGQSGEPDTLDMAKTESSISWEVGWAIFDTLIIADEKQTLYPALATSWDASSDGLSYTFKLRNDVKFHDGTPFNAQAVKYNLDRVVDPATGSVLPKDDLGPYDSSEVIDDFTVKVTMKQQYGFFIRAMSLMEFAMLSPKVKDMAVDDVGRNPIGSGPFKFKSWTPQSRIELVRNDDYKWGPMPPYSHSGPAYVEQLTFQFLTDNPTRVAALESGEVNAIMKTPDTDVERLKSAGFQIIKGYQTGMPTGFFVNTNKFPTNDAAVRKAINLGLNRQQISDSLYASQEAPGFCPLTPTTFAFWDCTQSIYFDVKAAQKTLEDAGWTKGSGGFYQKDGKPLKLEVYVFGTDGTPGEAFQAAIKAAGIDVDLKVTPFANQHSVGFNGDHNLMLGRFDAPDPNILSLLFHSRNAGPNGFTWTHLKESQPDVQKQIDDLLDKGQNEIDPDKRKQDYIDVQKIIVEQNMFVAMKYDTMNVALQKNVQGWKMNDLGYQERVYDVNFT